MSEIALQSMTGFGKANGQFEDKKIAVEIRSLNSKGLDLNLKIPSHYRDLESPIRKLITEELLRGKMDIGIYIESQQQQTAGLLNEKIATAYFHKLKALNDTWGTQSPDYLSLILRLPDVLTSQTDALTEEESSYVLDLVQTACQQLKHFRKEEGQSLAQDLLTNLDCIQQELSAIAPFEQERVAQVRERIQKGLATLDEARIDANRLEQEMIYYVEKLDISEEKQRLSQHLHYFSETLQQDASGNKIRFYCTRNGP